MSNTRDNERNTEKRDKTENSSNKPLPPTQIHESQKPLEKKNPEKIKVKGSKLLPTILPNDDVDKNTKKISKASKHVPSKERNVSKNRESKSGSSGFLPPSFPTESGEKTKDAKTGIGQRSKSVPKISLLEKVQKENIQAGDGFIKAGVSKQKEQAKAFQEIAKKIISNDKPKVKPDNPTTLKTENKGDDKPDIKVTGVKSKESIRVRAKSEPRKTAVVETKNSNLHPPKSSIRESKTGSPTLKDTTFVDINSKNVEFPVQKQELHAKQSGKPSSARKVSGNNIATGENAIKPPQKSHPPKETSPVRSKSPNKSIPENTTNDDQPKINVDAERVGKVNIKLATKNRENPLESINVNKDNHEIRDNKEIVRESPCKEKKPPTQTATVNSIYNAGKQIQITTKNLANDYEPEIKSETAKLDELNRQPPKSPNTKSLESMEIVKVKTDDIKIQEGKVGRMTPPVVTKNKSPIKLKEAQNEFKENPKEENNMMTPPTSKNYLITTQGGLYAPNERPLQQSDNKDAVTIPKKEIENFNPTKIQQFLGDGPVISDIMVHDYANKIVDACMPTLVPSSTFVVKQSSQLFIKEPEPCQKSPQKQNTCRSSRTKPASDKPKNNSPPSKEPPASQSSSPGRANRCKETASNCSGEDTRPMSIRVVGSPRDDAEPRKKKKKKKKCDKLKPSKSKSTQSASSRCCESGPRGKRSKSQDSGSSKKRRPNCCTPRCEDETCPGNDAFNKEDGSSYPCTTRRPGDYSGIFQRISSAVGGQLQYIACRSGRFRVPGGLGFYQPDSTISGWVGQVLADNDSPSSSCSSFYSTSECRERKKAKKDRAGKDDDTLDTDDTGNVFDRVSYADNQEQSKKQSSSKKVEKPMKKTVERNGKSETVRKSTFASKTETHSILESSETVERNEKRESGRKSTFASKPEWTHIKDSSQTAERNEKSEPGRKSTFASKTEKHSIQESSETVEKNEKSEPDRKSTFASKPEWTHIKESSQTAEGNEKSEPGRKSTFVLEAESNSSEESNQIVERNEKSEPGKKSTSVFKTEINLSEHPRHTVERNEKSKTDRKRSSGSKPEINPIKESGQTVERNKKSETDRKRSSGSKPERNPIKESSQTVERNEISETDRKRSSGSKPEINPIKESGQTVERNKKSETDRKRSSGSKPERNPIKESSQTVERNEISETDRKRSSGSKPKINPIKESSHTVERNEKSETDRKSTFGFETESNFSEHPRQTVERNEKSETDRKSTFGFETESNFSEHPRQTVERNEKSETDRKRSSGSKPEITPIKESIHTVERNEKSEPGRKSTSVFETERSFSEHPRHTVERNEKSEIDKKPSSGSKIESRSNRESSQKIERHEKSETERTRSSVSKTERRSNTESSQTIGDSQTEIQGHGKVSFEDESVEPIDTGSFENIESEISEVVRSEHRTETIEIIETREEVFDDDVSPQHSTESSTEMKESRTSLNYGDTENIETMQRESKEIPDSFSPGVSVKWSEVDKRPTVEGATSNMKRCQERQRSPCSQYLTERSPSTKSGDCLKITSPRPSFTRTAASRVSRQSVEYNATSPPLPQIENNRILRESSYRGQCSQQVRSKLGLDTKTKESLGSISSFHHNVKSNSSPKSFSEQYASAKEQYKCADVTRISHCSEKYDEMLFLGQKTNSSGGPPSRTYESPRRLSANRDYAKPLSQISSMSGSRSPQTNHVSPCRYNNYKSQIGSEQKGEKYINDRKNRPPSSRQSGEIPSKRQPSMDFSSSPRKSSFLRSFEQKWKPVFEKYSSPCREYSSGSFDLRRRSENPVSKGVTKNSRSKGVVEDSSPRWCTDPKHLESEMVPKYYDNRFSSRSKQSTLDNSSIDSYSVLANNHPERASPGTEETTCRSAESDNETSDTKYNKKSNVVYSRLSTNSENEDNFSQHKQGYDESKKEEGENSDSTIGCCEDDSESSDSYQSSDCETTISRSKNGYSTCSYTDFQDGRDRAPKQNKRKLKGRIVIRSPDIFMKRRQVSIQNFNVKMECPEKMEAFPQHLQSYLRHNRTCNRRPRTDSDSDKGIPHQRSRTTVSDVRRRNNIQHPHMPNNLNDEKKFRAFSLSPERTSLSIADTLPYSKHDFIAMSNSKQQKAYQTQRKHDGHGRQKVDCFQEVITPDQSTHVCKMDSERSVPGYFSDSDKYVTSKKRNVSTPISSKDIEASINAAKVQAQYDPVCSFHDYIFDEVMQDDSKPHMPGQNDVYSQNSFVFDTECDDISSTNSMALWFTRESDSSRIDNNYSSSGGKDDYFQGQPSFNSYHENPTDRHVSLISCGQNTGDSDDVNHLKQMPEAEHPRNEMFLTDEMVLLDSTNGSQLLFDKFKQISRSSLMCSSNVTNRASFIHSHADSKNNFLKNRNNFDNPFEKSTAEKKIGTKICLPETLEKLEALTYEQSSHDDESSKIKCDYFLKHTLDDNIRAYRAKAIQCDSSDMNSVNEDMLYPGDNSMIKFEDMPPSQVDQITHNYLETYCTSELLDAFSENKWSNSLHEKTRFNNQSNLKNIVKSDDLSIRGNINNGRAISPSFLPKTNCEDISDDEDDFDNSSTNNCGSETLEKRDNDENLEPPYLDSHCLEDDNSVFYLNKELEQSKVNSDNSLPSMLPVDLCRGNGCDSKPTKELSQLVCDSESKQGTQTKPCISEKERDKSMSALSTNSDVCTSLLKLQNHCSNKCSSPADVHDGWSKCSDKICPSVCDDLKGKQQGGDTLLKWAKGKLMKEIKKIGATIWGPTKAKECNPIKKAALKGSSVDFTNTCFLNCTGPRCSTIHFDSLDKDVGDTCYKERRHKIYRSTYISKPYKNKYHCSDNKRIECNPEGDECPDNKRQVDRIKHVANPISQDGHEQPVLSRCVDCTMGCRKQIPDDCSVTASVNSDSCSLHEHPSSPVDGFVNDYNRRPIQDKSSEEHDYDTNALVLVSEYLDSKQKSYLRKKRRRKDATRLAIKKLSLFDPDTFTFNKKTETKSSSRASTNSQVGKQSYITSNEHAGQLAIKRSIASIFEPLCFKSSFLKNESAATWKSEMLCSCSKMDDSAYAMTKMLMFLETRSPSRRVVKMNTSYRHSWVTPDENHVLLEACRHVDCANDSMQKDKQCISAPLSKGMISTTCKGLKSKDMICGKEYEPSYYVEQTNGLDYGRECQKDKCASAPLSKSMISTTCCKGLKSEDMICGKEYVPSYYVEQTNGLDYDRECQKDKQCASAPLSKSMLPTTCCKGLKSKAMNSLKAYEPCYFVKQTYGLGCEKESPKKHNTWEMSRGINMPSKSITQFIKDLNEVPRGYSQDWNQNANHGVNNSSPRESLSGISSESNADMVSDKVSLDDFSPSNVFYRGGINRSKGVLDLPTMYKNYSEKKKELHSFYKRFKYRLKEKDDEPFSEPVYQPSDMYRRDIQFAEFACKNVNSSGNIFDSFASENEMIKKNDEKKEGSEEDFHSAEDDDMIPYKKHESVGDCRDKGYSCCHIADVCNHRQFSIAEECSKKRMKNLRHNCNCFLKHCLEDRNKWKTLQHYQAPNHAEGLSNTTCEGICFSNNRSEQDERQIIFPLYTALSGKRRRNLRIFQDNGPRNNNPPTIKEFVNWYVIDDENDSRREEATDTQEVYDKPVSRNRSETNIEQQSSYNRENSHPVKDDSKSGDIIQPLTSNGEELPNCEENEKDESDETEQSSSSEEETDRYSDDRIAIERMGYRLLAGCVHTRFNEEKMNSYYRAKKKKDCYKEQLKKCNESTKGHISKLRQSMLIRGSRELFFPKDNDSWKYHIKGTYLRASNSKSLEDIEVPMVEKERVRFACDKDGDWAEVGRGSYGCVYLGLLDGEIEVAIKDFFESSSYDHIIHEARMLFYLQDTGITPKLYGLRRRFDAKKQPGEFCIIMEYFGDGKTLFNVLSDKTELTTNEWIDVLGQLVAGLRLIHKRNILLNDLKADNILIDLYGDRKTIRYIDVGMATYKQGLAFQLPQNQMGKYNFLAPEVRDGIHTSKRSDIYSLGYMLDQILRVAGSALDGLEGLVSYCMDEDPKKRPNVDEIVANVHKFIESSFEIKSNYGKKRLPVQKTV